MLDKTTIKAAFDGIVTARYADPGAMANPAKPLLRVEQMKPVKIVGSIIEKDIDRIKPGQTKAVVKVDSIAETFLGKVEKIYPTINHPPERASWKSLLRTMNTNYALACSHRFNYCSKQRKTLWSCLET